nr:MAG TPA: hypothetical protein [Bacteriophage sp.]
MAQFNVPSESQRFSAVVETFRGVDLNNSPSNVDKSRSPAAPNMIRDQVGKVRKRMGYTTKATAPEGAAIHGVHHLMDETLIHAGSKLYRLVKAADGTWSLTEIGAMANSRSRSFVFDQKLYLLDGTTYQVYDGETLTAVADSAAVPTIIISRRPNGGGQSYEGLNLLGKKWTESFLGTKDDKTYQLTTKELSDDPVTAKVLDANGNWVDKVENTDFTVDRAKGTVTFTTAPGESPVTGQDNVQITACKVREGYLDAINKCTIAAVYGVGGSTDRVFLSGNGDKPGIDWYSSFEDPAFWPDTNYTKLVRDGGAVTGYAVLSNTLAAFINGASDERNVVVRGGTLDEDGDALFRISNTMIGQDAVAPDTFCRTDKEPLFLTDRGVFAITAEELTGEKYSQERSYYIGSALRAAQDRQSACACIYGDLYALALDGTIYLLDLQQKTYERNSPYSSFQYECYYWPGIPATVLFLDGDALCFGTADGKLCRFGTNVDDVGGYNDDGLAIDAYWETSDFDGKIFFHVKTFTGLAVRLAAATNTGVVVYAQVRGIWKKVFSSGAKARYFDWNYIDFSKFTFSADRTPRTLFGKIKIKKADKVRFRLQNDVLNEPFGLYAFGLQFKEPGGNYKR